MDPYTIFAKGGIISYVLLVCSILSIASFLERFIKFNSCKIDTDRFLSTIEQLVKKDELVEALKVCNRYASPVARVVQAGLVNFGASKEKMTVCLEEAALKEFAALEVRVGILATIAHISPLLGLLGTVNGMIRAFQVIEQKSRLSGLASPTDLAQGIWVALITTAMGIVVAIPAIIAYNYLHQWLQRIKVDMERGANKILALNT